MQLIHGDCLEEMKKIPDKSVDMILCDLPFGVTACNWDKIISFEKLWKEWKRIIISQGSTVLFGVQPFTTLLVNSNFEEFKYTWIWEKTKPNGWQHAKNKPMQVTEDIIIFSQASMGHESILNERRMIYNPQGVTVKGSKEISSVFHGRMMGARPNQVGKVYDAYEGFPSNILRYANINGSKAIHPTQKPVPLLEYLIKTYTNPGDLVLDNCMGSGSTGIACLNTGRDFIGIELYPLPDKPISKQNPNYFGIAQKRIARWKFEEVENSEDEQINLF